MSWAIAVAAFVIIVAFQFVISRSSSSSSSSASGVKDHDTANYHMRRKLQHALSGVGIAYFYHYQLTSMATAATLLLSGTAMYIMHRIRLVNPTVNQWLVTALGPILRAREYTELPGGAYMLFGCGLVVACAARSISLLVIMYLSIGDPLASLVGQAAGDSRTRWPVGRRDKSVIGSLAMAFACTFVTIVLFTYCDVHHGAHHNDDSHSDNASSRNSTAVEEVATMTRLSYMGVVAWCVMGSLVSAAAEAVGAWRNTSGTIHIDDNLSVPIITAACLTLGVRLGVLPSLA